MKKHLITSKVDGHKKRKASWGCLSCTNTFSQKVKTCSCGSNVHYFPSKAELRRFRVLQLEQRAESISSLELQPSFKIVLNGHKITTYRADFKYTRNGKVIFEDVKPTQNEKYLDPLFKLKKKLVEAIYGIEIEIVK